MASMGWSRFDSYSRIARISPGLLLLFGPIAVAIGAGMAEQPAATLLTAAIATVGLPVALAEWVRRHGQFLQDRLWQEWGGNPVVSALRDEGYVARWRREILASATGLPVDQTSNADFDEVAENAVRRLISATRDNSRYPLVFVENKAYGFARNLFAIRQMGISVSGVAIGCGLLASLLSFKIDSMSIGSTMTGTVAAVGIMIFWILYPSERRVRAAACDYRDRLLEALDDGVMAPQGSQASE